MSRASEARRRKFLEYVAQGMNNTEAAKAAGVKPVTVKAWQKRHEKFAAALKATKARVEMENTDALGLTAGKEVFLDVYKQTYSRVQAADAAGMKVGMLLSLIDPEDDAFDNGFAAAVKEIEARKALEVEDRAVHKALVGDSEGMQKFLLPNLPIVGDKYAPKKPDASPNQVFLFTGEGLEGATGFLKSLFGERRALTE